MKKIALATLSAALLTATNANAADLGRGAPAAVDYVKVCDAYGTGFFYIPGTETCLQIGGFVRAEFRAYEYDRVWGGTVGIGTRDSSDFTSLARTRLNFDARTATEFGLLRSFASLEFTVASQTGSTAQIDLRRAFIQWGGLTAGRSQSFFDFYTGDTWSSVFEPAHSDSAVNLLAYTFAFGNGISATLSLEDPRTGNVSRRLEGDAYGGNRSFDVVGNLNITQAWGSAQVMAAAHEDYALTATSGSKWGYAVGGGVTVKLPMLGEGDMISLQAAYAKGAASYVSPDWYTGYDFSAPVGASLVQTKAWSVAGGFTHFWTPKLSSSLTASYASFSDQRAAVTDDNKMFDLAVNLVWAPVDGLTIGGEVEYKDINFKDAATADRDALVGMLRIERAF